MKRVLRSLGIGASALLFVGTAPAGAEPAAYALVIGIDDYRGLPKLTGAVNDARLIEAALKANGAREVVTLINGDATRARIMATVRDLAAKAARDGSWLAITYAGHGGQEEARLPGDEADEQDEVLLLQDFEAGPSGNAERIPDNDVSALLESLPANLKILFLVDACHSGTVTRSADPRAKGITYRNASYGPIQDDQLPAPPKDSAGKEAQQLPNVLFIASALDSEKTPEIPISGAKHGAVSYYFAKALGGGADANADGRTTFAELRQYLVIAPRVLAEGRQTPGVYFDKGREQELFSLVPTRPVVNADRPQTPVKLWTTGGADGIAIEGARPVAGAGDADLIWDRSARQIIDNRTGDLIAEQPNGADEQRFAAGVIAKWLALSRLQDIVAKSPMAVDLAPCGAGARYGREQVEIRVAARSAAELRYLTVFNLAGDGTVQALFPANARESGPLDPAEVKSFANKVKPPFGADHVVAVAMAEEPLSLRAALKGLDGQQAPAEAAMAVSEAMKVGRSSVGLVGLFTGEQGQCLTAAKLEWAGK